MMNLPCVVDKGQAATEPLETGFSGAVAVPGWDQRIH